MALGKIALSKLWLLKIALVSKQLWLLGKQLATMMLRTKLLFSRTKMFI